MCRHHAQCITAVWRCVAEDQPERQCWPLSITTLVPPGVFNTVADSCVCTVRGEGDVHTLNILFFLWCGLVIFIPMLDWYKAFPKKWSSGFYTTDSLWTDNWEKRDRDRNSEADLLTGNVVLLLAERVQVLERSNYGWFLAAGENCCHSVEVQKWINMDSEHSFISYSALWRVVYACIHVKQQLKNVIRLKCHFVEYAGKAKVDGLSHYISNSYNRNNPLFSWAITYWTKWPSLLENFFLISFPWQWHCVSRCLVFRMVSISNSSKCILFFSVSHSLRADVMFLRWQTQCFTLALNFMCATDSEKTDFPNSWPLQCPIACSYSVTVNEL